VRHLADVGAVRVDVLERYVESDARWAGRSAWIQLRRDLGR